MESKLSLLYSQQPVNSPYPEPDESSPHPQTLFLENPFLCYSTTCPSASFLQVFFPNKSRDSVARIAAGYGLVDRGAGVRVPVGSRIFISQIVQIGSGVHPTSYTMGTGGTFPGVNRPGREADHLPPTSVEVKKMWIKTSTPPYVFMA
jgi:hypothetical protein